MSQKPFHFTACHERWEAMSPSERGRLCARCNTEIVDFRNSTEAQIERTIASSPVRICGYYSIAQLQKPGSRLAAAAAAATIALALPAAVEAQQQAPLTTTIDYPVRLVVLYIGYESRTAELADTAQFAEVQFELVQAMIGIVGIVVTGAEPAQPVKQPSFWRRVWQFFGGS